MEKAKQYKVLHTKIAAFISKFCDGIHLYAKCSIKDHIIHPR